MITGLSMCLGAILPYIVSYYRMYLNFDVNYDTFQPVQTLTEITAAFSFPISNFLIDYIFDKKVRPVIFIGAIFGLGFQYASVTFHVGPYIFIMLYTLGAGIIKGFYK